MSNQQAEIIKFAKTENDLPIWKSESIDERQAKLLIFAMENWSFDLIKVTPIQ